MRTLEELKAMAKNVSATPSGSRARSLDELKAMAKGVQISGGASISEIARQQQARNQAAAAQTAYKEYTDTIRNNMFSPALIQPQSWLEKQEAYEAKQKEIRTNSMYSPAMIAPAGWQESMARQQQKAQANADAERIAQLQAMIPGEAAAGNAETVKAMESELAQLQQRQTQNQYSSGRGIDTVTGSAKQYASGFVNAAGDVAQLGGASEREEELARLNAELMNPDLSAEERAQKQARVDYLNANPGTDNEVRQPQYYEAADRLAQSGAEDIARAKEGQGGIGQTLVDVGSGALQLGADVALGVLTGGGTMLPMSVRSYGSGSQEARNSDANLGQSVLAGSASALVEYLTEQISNVSLGKVITGPGGKKMTGALDDVVKNAIEKAVIRYGKTASDKAAINAILQGAASFGGEFLEEAVSSLVSPLVERIYNDKALRQYGTLDFWKEAAYEGITGGLVGLIAGGAEQVSEYGKNKAMYEAQQGPAKMSLADFTNNESPVWNNVAYNDTETQNNITQQTHTEMVNAGEIVQVDDSTTAKVGESYPDLRSMKKSERTPILKQKMTELKNALRQVLSGLKENTYDFTVNGNILEAKLYETGIREVMEKVTQDKASMLYHSDEVFKNARYLYSTEDYDGNPNIYRWNYFYTPVQIGDDVVGVRIAVRDMVHSSTGKPDSQIYNWGIKKNAPLDGGGQAQSANATGVSSGADFPSPTITQNGPVVKSDETSNYGTLPEGMGAASAGFADSAYNRWVNGADEFLPAGENAVRNPSMPTVDPQGRKIMKTAQTVMEAEQTPDSRIPTIEAAAVQGELSYDSVTNAELAANAEAAVEYKGWGQAMDDWRRSVYSGKVSDELVAMGAVLLNNAGNSNMSGTEYVGLLVDYSTLLNKAGKAVQAARLLKRLTPEGRLYGIQKSVERLVDEYGGKYDFTLDEALVDKYRAADSDKARDAVITEIQQSIADQVPSTLLDKWTALRYVNMLGNFKTQIRNVLGNTIMGATARLKNKVAAAIELGVYAASGGKFERTKALTVSKELRRAARADFSNVEKIALGEAKYQDGSLDADLQGIDEMRTIFKNNGTWGTTENSGTVAKAARKVTDLGWRTLEAYRKATNWVMEKGDVIFSREAYASALAGWMKTHNITAEQWDSGEVDTDTVDKARAYAIKEAQEATFRDNNAFSDWVSRVGRRKDTPKGIKAVSEGVMPFRKTPANVLVRAEEYSPLGIINTAVTAAKAAKGTNGITGNDVINSAAKTLTGTGIFALGYLLRSLRRLNGSGDEPDENIQDYSLVLPDGTNYTIDWMSPLSMPLFMGVQLFDMLQDDGFQWSDIEGALSSIADPLIQMSMLSGVNDTLDNIKFSENNLIQTVVSGALGYLTQGLTNTLIGQIESASEKYRQTTTVDKDSNIPAYIQRVIGKASAKTPGVDYAQADYIDVWGRREENPTGAANIFETFLSPGYVNRSDSDPVVQETNRLYEAGFTSAKPTRPSQSFTYSENGQKVTVNLDAQEYQEYQEQIGTTRYDLVKALMDTDAFAALSDERKSDVLSNIYSYAEAMAKASVSGYQPENWMLDVSEMEPSDAAEYLAVRDSFSNAKSGDDIMTFDELMELWDSFGSDAQAAMMDMSGFENYKTVADADIDLEWYNAAKSAYNEVKTDRTDGEAPQYDLIDQLTDYWIGLDKERKAILDDVFGTSYSQLGKVLDAAETGMTASEWYEVKDKYDEIGEQDMSAAQKEVAFNHWLESVGWLDSKQADLMDEQFTYGTYMSANPEKYENLQTYMSETKAHDVYNVVSNLKPVNGASAVSQLQKYDAVMSVRGLSESEYQHALSEYSGYTEGDKDKFATAYKYNIPMQTVVAAYRWADNYKTANSKSSLSAAAAQQMAQAVTSDKTVQGILYAMFGPSNTKTMWNGYAPYYFDAWVYAE